MIPRSGELVSLRVVKCSRDGDGALNGCQHSNLVLGTRQYEVELQYGSIDTYTANLIAENLLAQVDPEGQRCALFKGIVDHRYVDHEPEML
jgi:hypothetical protein